MVQLYQVTVPAQKVQLELLLKREHGQKMVETVHPVASEYEFVIFEKIVSVLIYIDLKRRVKGMDGQFVMVGECDDVISELRKGVIYLRRIVFTFIEDAVDTGVGVEIRPFPAMGRIEVTIRIKDVRSLERDRIIKCIYRAYACSEDSKKGRQHHAGKNLRTCP